MQSSSSSSRWLHIVPSSDVCGVRSILSSTQHLFPNSRCIQWSLLGSLYGFYVFSCRKNNTSFLHTQNNLCTWPIVPSLPMFPVPKIYEPSISIVVPMMEHGSLSGFLRTAALTLGMGNENENLTCGQQKLPCSLILSRNFHGRSQRSLYKRNFEMSIVLARQNLTKRILSALKDESTYDGGMHKLKGLNVRLTSAIVARILRSPLPPEVLWSFFNWAKLQPHFKHDQVTYTIMVHQLRKGQMQDAMKQTLEDMRIDGLDISLTVYTDMIAAYARNRNVQAVQETWSEMKQAGSQPDAACFNIVMKLFLEKKQYQMALQFYKDMLQSRCCPDANTYHILIQSLLDAGKLEAAHLILKKMPGFGIQPYATTFDVMVRANLKAGQLDTVTELLLEMKETHREPREATMRKVHEAFETAGKNMDVLKQELPSFFIGVDDVPLTTTEQGSVHETSPELEYGFSYAFKPSLVRKVQSWGPSAITFLDNLGFKWNASAAYDLVKGLPVDAAFGFFQWLKDQEGYMHDIRIYSKMITLLLTNRRYEDIERLLDEMVYLGLGVQTIVLNLVIESYGSNHDALGALAVYRRMLEVGSQPNEVTFTSMIDILMRHAFYQQAMDVYATMLQSGFQPNAVTYSVLIHGLGIAGKAEAGHKLLNIMLKHGYKPNVITYTALMGAYSRINNITKVMELYNVMQDLGIGPTPITYKVLARALYKAGHVEAAKEMEEKLHSLVYSGIGESVLRETRESICNDLLNSLEVIVGNSHLGDNSKCY